MIGDDKGEVMMNLIGPALILGLYVAIILYSIIKRNKKEEEVEQELPCDTCVRWEECNGVDIDYCPLTKK